MGSGLAGGGSVGSGRASGEVCCAGDIECNAYLSESHSVVCSTHSYIFFPAPHSGARLSRAVEAVLSGPSRLCHLGRCAGVPAFSLLFLFFSLCHQLLSQGRYECGLAYHAVDALVFGLPPPLDVCLN